MGGGGKGWAWEPRLGVWGKAPSRGRQGCLEAEPPALVELYNFSINITQFYAYFGQNSYSKAITHQFKAFKMSLNVLYRINEVQVL